MPAASVDDLIATFESPEFTRADYEREHALLVDRFWLEHGVLEEQIDEACNGHLHGSQLADAWCSLQVLRIYVTTPS